MPGMRRRKKSGKHAMNVLAKKIKNMPGSSCARKKKETCRKVVAQEKRMKRKKFNIRKKFLHVFIK